MVSFQWVFLWLVTQRIEVLNSSVVADIGLHWFLSCLVFFNFLPGFCEHLAQQPRAFIRRLYCLLLFFLVRRHVLCFLGVWVSVPEQESLHNEARVVEVFDELFDLLMEGHAPGYNVRGHTAPDPWRWVVFS